MYVQNDVRITVRVDKTLKENAELLFEHLGMNMSTAFNIFLRKAIAEQAIPFPVSIKPDGFGAGYSSDDVTRAFAETVARDIADNRQQGFPIARYDTAEGRAYLEGGDGAREYVGKDRR